MKQKLNTFIVAVGIFSVIQALVGIALGAAIQELTGFFKFNNPPLFSSLMMVGEMIATAIFMKRARVMERLPEDIPGLGYIKLYILLVLASLLAFASAYSGNASPQKLMAMVAPSIALGQILLTIGIIQLLMAVAPAAEPAEPVKSE